MDNYKVVEVKSIYCLWSDVYSSYVASSNPVKNGIDIYIYMCVCVCVLILY